MSEPQSQPVTPDLPPPFGTPDLDVEAEEVVRDTTDDGAAGGGGEADGSGDPADSGDMGTVPLGQDVNPDAASVEPPD